MAYLGKTPSQAVRSRYYFTASGGETSLSPSEVTSLSFTDANYVDVSLNGVALVSGTDYTATPSTNTISGLAALTASDVVEIVVYDTFSVFGGNVNGDFNISGGDLTLGDNDKAIFGAGSDLQIYHDGSNSYVADKGTGNLVLQADASFKLENADATKTSIFAQPAGAVQLKYDNSTKLATTSSGIDVTGTVTADGLTVDNAGVVRLNPSSGDDFLTIQQGGSQAVITADSAAGAGNLVFRTTSAGSDTDTMLLAANGDISFYDNTGTTQGLFWDASEVRLGLGTTSPARNLHLYAENSDASVRFQNTANSKVWEINPSIPGVANSGISIVNVTDNTVPLHIDNSGNVGIGESNPLSSLHIDAANGAENFIRLHDGDSDYGAALGLGSTGDFVISTYHGGTLLEALRVDRPTGNVLVADTTNVGTADHKVSIQKGSAGRCLGLGTTVTTATVMMSLVNGNGTVGTIQTNGTATSYVTSSDHRLKENVADMTGAIDRVKALAPKRFNFIADADTTVDGFLAHEAQAVVPEAVTGTHNEVDDDGNAVMQGIDQSKLVPLLTGALREAIAKIETLETRLTALENAE